MTDTKARREGRNERLRELTEKGQAAGLWTVTSLRADIGNWAAWAYLKDPEGNAYTLRAEDDGRIYGGLDTLALPWTGAAHVGMADVRRIPGVEFTSPSFGAGQDSLALLRAIKRRLLEAGKPYAQAIREEAAKRTDSRVRLEAQARELRAAGWRVELSSSYYSGRCWAPEPHYIRGEFNAQGAVTLDRVEIRRVDLLADLLPLLGGAK
ncbi:MAG: hypothetical protein GXC94_02025 [Comamonadaceae bacterium]|nr:hypothetical protein [Comamonadaceae bacterium]